jgi:hypothetical protein
MYNQPGYQPNPYFQPPPGPAPVVIDLSKKQ